MLKKIVLIALMFVIGISFAKQSDKTSSEEAIKSLIASENENWANRNFEGWADAWAHERYILAMYPTDSPPSEFVGWDSLRTFSKSFYEKNNTPLNVDITRSNWNIRIHNDAAWASYIQKINSRADGEELGKSREVRFLEKIDGKWKIVYLSAVYQSSENQESVEYNLNEIGYELLNLSKFQEAIEVFKMNVKFYPESWNVYDSLGEAYMKNGDKELALENYQKSLELNPSNENAVLIIKKLKE